MVNDIFNLSDVSYKESGLAIMGTTKKSILIATSRLEYFSGSEINVLELAMAFVGLNYDVTISAVTFAEPLQAELTKLDVQMIEIDELPEGAHFDFVWVQHWPVYNQLILKTKVSTNCLVYSSLAAIEPLECPPLPLGRLDCLLVNSIENHNWVEQNIPEYIPLSSIFVNTAPEAFFQYELKHEPVERLLRKIAVVSNHIPKDIESAIEVLTEQHGVVVDVYGLHRKEELVTPELLSRYQAVITIGKTVQYALTMGIPVYCYDHFGGPGWLLPENFDEALKYNFFGRCSSQKDISQIVEELVGCFERANGHMPLIQSRAKSLFSLKANLVLLLEQMENKLLTKVELSVVSYQTLLRRQNIATLRAFKESMALLDMIHSTKSLNSLLEDSRLKENIIELKLDDERANSQLLQSALDVCRAENQNILKSTSWRVTKPMRFIKRVVTSRRPHREILKPIYQRSPSVLKLRLLIDTLVKKVSHRLIDITASTNNLGAIRSLSENRFNYSMKKKVVDVGEEYPTIDVTVVTFNSQHWVEQFFNSLVSQNFPVGKINLFISDNGSTDSTVQKIELFLEKYSAIFNSTCIIKQSNVGFGKGHDSCLQKGSAEYCLITNIDLEFEEEAISTVVSAAQNDAADVASWELRQVPFEHPKYYDPVTLETNWSSHACILIKRAAYQEVGGYEPKIFMYCEDVELSYRFRANGYKIKYCPSAVVKHYTYQEINQIKPLQYAGSILGNGYLRLRYGLWKDKVAIIPQYLKLLVRGQEPFEGAKKLIKSNIKTTLKNFCYFLKKPLNNGIYFPFRGFDYDLIREGAFYEVPILKEGPLVSIITRTYAGRDVFLQQAIHSVKNQTYKNIELIVVEDGGDTLETLVREQTMPAGKQISYFHCPKVGRSVTGNYGLSKARGEFLMFLDDDDLLFADHVEVLLDVLLKDGDIVASYALSMEVGTNTQTEGQSYVEDYFHTPPSFRQEYDYEVLSNQNYITIQSILFHRACFDERGGFDIELDQLEDWNLWLRYGFQNKFSFVPKTTSLYRVPSSSDVKLARHQLLHEAYGTAKAKAQAIW